MKIASTERLTLETWSDDDAADLAAIGSAQVVRYLGGEPWTEATARSLIALWRGIEDRLGVTTWAVRLRSSGELVGTCGFAGTNAPWLRFEHVVEVGWTLGRPWWGQGLATEAAGAAIGVGLGRIPPDRIISKCHVDHVASERVMQRIGMRRVGVVRGAEDHGTVLYRMRIPQRDLRDPQQNRP
jgi:RimJ/RimL family protein N-acetyltransferase